MAARGAKKTTKKKAAKRAPAKTAAVKTVAPNKRAKAAAKPSAPLKLPRLPRRPPARKVVAFSPAFATQRERASHKDLLLFELQRARVAVNASLQGMPGGAAEREVRPGGWTIRLAVLHLAVRDRARFAEFDAALAGTPASWVGLDDVAMSALNEMQLQPFQDFSWDMAVRLLHINRAQLLDRLVAVPHAPDELWTEQHAFGAMLWRLPSHDRHHAEQIKNARIRG